MPRHVVPLLQVHAIEGMHALVGRLPSDGQVAGGSPAVAEESPVRTSSTRRDSGATPRTSVTPTSNPRNSSASSSSRISSSSAGSSISQCSGGVPDMNVNYMVLGETGLGKSTFVYNLVSGFKVLHPGRAHVEEATTMRQFKEDPSSLRTVLAPLDMPESNNRLIITIQDMPGWGEDLNLRRYLRTIITFLLTMRAKDYDMLNGNKTPKSTSTREQGKPDSTDSLQLKHSFTACLYFLPPHRVKPADLVIMAAVSELVTVIPIISKSDSMTEDELACYRQDIARMLQRPGKFVADKSLADIALRTFNMAQPVLKRVGLQQLPVAVNCSRHKEACSDESLLAMVGPHGLYRHVQPVRQYPWGAVYPLAREHQSDLIPLKRLLLGDQVDNLQALLDDSYKRYMSFCEEFEDYEQELQALVQDMWVLGRPLEFDDYETVRGCLEKAQTAKKKLQQENKQLAAKLKKAEAERKFLQERFWR